MKHVRHLSPLVPLMLFVSLVGAKFYSPPQYNHYQAGPAQHHDPGKPTSRHKYVSSASPFLSLLHSLVSIP